MTAERDTTRIVRSWLEEGRTALPDRVLDAVLDQIPATRQRRSWWPARRARPMSTLTRLGLAAAVVLVAVVVGWRFLPSSDIGGRASPTPVVTPGPTDRLVETEGPLAPGTWSMDVESLRVTFDIPAAGWVKNIVPGAIWSAGSEGRFSFSVVDNLFADPCGGGALREPPVGPTVDDLANALATLPGIEATGPTEATLGNRPAKLVEFSLAADEEPCAPQGVKLWPIPGLSDPAPLESAARTRYWILDVQGTRLVVGAVERDGLITVMRNELQSILDSVRIERR